MTRSQYLAAWRDSHSAPDILMVKIFLSLVYFSARALISIRISPNLATIIGGLIGGAAALLAISEQWLWAAAIAAFSSLLDGIDGAIAEITNRKSKFGAVLDAVVDRLVELSWFTALALVGADLTAVVSLGLAILIMEYTRTKANSLGLAGAGMITIAERPTRVIMFSMLCVGVSMIGTDNSALTVGSWMLTAVTLIATVQLFSRFANQLRNNTSR